LFSVSLDAEDDRRKYRVEKIRNDDADRVRSPRPQARSDGVGAIIELPGGFPDPLHDLRGEGVLRLGVQRARCRGDVNVRGFRYRPLTSLGVFAWPIYSPPKGKRSNPLRLALEKRALTVRKSIA